MDGLKIKALIATIIVVGGGATIGAVGLTKKSSGISSTAAGAKIAAKINEGPQATKVVKALQCLKGKDGTSFLCALAVTSDGQTVICALAAATVTTKAVKITNFTQADPTVCYFAT